MKNYNVRKRQFLELIYKFGKLTAREIETLTDFTIGIKNIMVLLKRYHNFGYLHRQKNIYGVFVYRLNPTGEKKLLYLLKNKSDFQKITIKKPVKNHF